MLRLRLQLRRLHQVPKTCEPTLARSRSMWQCIGECQYLRQSLASHVATFARRCRIQRDVVSHPASINQSSKCVYCWRATPRLVFNNCRRRCVCPARQLTFRNACTYARASNCVCPSHIFSVAIVLSDWITSKPALLWVPKRCLSKFHEIFFTYQPCSAHIGSTH